MPTFQVFGSLGNSTGRQDIIHVSALAIVSLFTVLYVWLSFL